MADSDFKLTQEEPVVQNTPQNTPKKDVKIGGLLAFYIYVFVAIGSTFTLILNLANLNSSDYADNWALMATDIICWLLYAFLGGYIIYAFVKRLPNAVALAKIHLVLLLVMNGSFLLLGQTDSSSVMESPTRLVSSLIWAVVFFVYLSFSDRVKALIPKETRRLFKFDKIIIFSAIGLIVVLFIYGLTAAMGINPLMGKHTKVKTALATVRNQLPMNLDGGLSWTDVRLDRDTIVIEYEYDSSFYEFGQEKRQLFGLMGKERYLASLHDPDGDEFAEFFEDDFYLKFRFNNLYGSHIYSYIISPLDHAIETFCPSYTTGEDVLNNIVNVFNATLPMDFVGGTLLNSAEYDDSDNGFIFDVTIPDVDYYTLPLLNTAYLRDYLNDNFSFITNEIMELAYMNDYPVTFKFGADCSSSWSRTVTFSSDEYKNLISF